jgi:hypothetical protein
MCGLKIIYKSIRKSQPTNRTAEIKQIWLVKTQQLTKCSIDCHSITVRNRTRAASVPTAFSTSQEPRFPNTSAVIPSEVRARVSNLSPCNS